MTCNKVAISSNSAFVCGFTFCIKLTFLRAWVCHGLPTGAHGSEKNHSNGIHRWDKLKKCSRLLNQKRNKRGYRMLCQLLLTPISINMPGAGNTRPNRIFVTFKDFLSTFHSTSWTIHPLPLPWDVEVLPSPDTSVPKLGPKWAASNTSFSYGYILYPKRFSFQDGNSNSCQTTRFIDFWCLTPIFSLGMRSFCSLQWG